MKHQHEVHVCMVCGEEHGLDDIHLVEIKGKMRKICAECVLAIKGLA
jgi:hypothetical protein